MAYENLCMYCFGDLKGESVCPHCGKDARDAVPQIQMLPGTLIYRDRFLVGRALGQDANGIVYIAMDTKRGGTIRIREYLPRNCAERLGDGSVVPVSGMEDAYEAGMKKLRASVDSVENPQKRHFYFEENGTAYIAQRKSAEGGKEEKFSDEPDEAGDHRKQIALYIAIAAAVVLVIAIGLIWFLNSMSDSSDVKLDTPLASASANATWMPAVTPTATPYATATFAALVDPELSWMDYTYTGDVNSDYNQQVNASATRAPSTQAPATRAPIILDNPQDYPAVNNSSDTSNVRALQQYLVKLGWLDSVSGSYDAATRQAVKDFQNYVNEYCSPAKKLTVDGIAGKNTQQWLYNSSVSLVRPTATPKPPVTAEPNAAVVDASSSKADVRAVQNKLIALGCMAQGGADGVFGATTANGVKNFQIRVNELQGYSALSVTGKVDALTMAYLNYYIDWWESQHSATATPGITAALPTPSPVPTATTAISDAVNANSSRTEIKSVQKMLASVGLLASGDVDGVYGKGTVAAVKNFQSWVNAQRGTETLKVSGECDMLTRSYLEYCVENGRTVSPSKTPTPAPTATPTPAPTDVPEEKDDSNQVDADSPKESINFVQEMLAAIGLLDDGDITGSYGASTANAVIRLQQYVNEQKGAGTLPVNGKCDAQTLKYLEYCYDHDMKLGGGTSTQAPTDAPTDAPSTSVNAGSTKAEIAAVQKLLAGVKLLDAADADGSYGQKTLNAVTRFQQFVNSERGAGTLAVTGECDEMTLQYLQYCYDAGWDVGAKTATQAPTQAPTDAPAAGTVSGFSISVDGQSADGSLIELQSGRHTITWGAQSGAASYYVRLYDSSNALINSRDAASETQLDVNTSGLRPGEIYTLRVGAMPENGAESDIVWQNVQLMLPVQATDAPTAEPTQKPVVGKPVINLGSSGYQSEGVPYVTDSTVIFSWMADGAVESYDVYLLSQDGTRYALGTTTETSKTVPADQLSAGLYRLYVGARPSGGSDDDVVWTYQEFGIPAPQSTPAPDAATDAPDDAPGGKLVYIDAASSAEDIQTVQMALYRYGLLNTDGLTPGVLDRQTLEAVAAFQTKLNETLGLGLSVIDPDANGAIDETTLDYLLYQNIGG